MDIHRTLLTVSSSTDTGASTIIGAFFTTFRRNVATINVDGHIMIFGRSASAYGGGFISPLDIQDTAINVNAFKGSGSLVGIQASCS